MPAPPSYSRAVDPVNTPPYRRMYSHSEYTVSATATGYTSSSQTETFSEVNCVTSAPLLVIGLFQSP